MLKAVLTLSILGVRSRFTTINAPLMKKIVITFIDLPYVLLLHCKYISKKLNMQPPFNQHPQKRHKNPIFINQTLKPKYKPIL